MEKILIQVKMVEKTRCEICDRNFKDQDGLDHHNSSKHPKLPKDSKKTFLFKKIRNWSIFIFILGLLIFLIVSPTVDSIKENSELNFEAPSGPIHWHPQLKIILNGVERGIPPQIGIGPGGHSQTHTHEGNGVIHLESNNPTKKIVTLGYFFDTWNKELSQECIFEYCVDKGELKMSVNGKENFDFDNYFMKDGDKIIIEYNSFS